jgi:hypothetical protein
LEFVPSSLEGFEVNLVLECEMVNLEFDLELFKLDKASHRSEEVVFLRTFHFGWGLCDAHLLFDRLVGLFLLPPFLVE